ncbi:MAG: WD40-like beta Propeller containing protein, partial [Gammaproteobacteria bacterium]|nr:WD40-like beta Propeller containing protein [Gammaproteobacteria bacterium]
MKISRELAAGFLLSLWTAVVWAGDATLPAGDAVRGPLTADDFYRAAALSDPQVSPDGSWVAYVVTTNDREADEQRSAIWLVSWDGAQQFALTGAAAETARPRWSTDGRYLAYLATAAGSDKVQIMVLDRRGGNARQLTGVRGTIRDYAWSPDGKRIALAMDQAGSFSDEPPGAADKSPKPIVIEGMHFKRDEEGYVGSDRVRHLYLLDVESKRLEALTRDARFNEDLPTWSPDGTRILFTRSGELGMDPDGRSDIDVIDARPDADARAVARCFAPNTQNLAWSPDGTAITYLRGLQPKFNAYMQDHLVLVRLAGGAPRELTDKLDRAVSSYAFSHDGAIMATVEDDGTAYPARIDVGNGAITREAPVTPSVVASISSQAGHTALLRSTDSALAEVYALEAGKLRKLTGHNDAFLAERRLGAVEDIRFKSKDGAEIHGIIVKPPSFESGRKYPTVLWIHGGPNGQDEHALVLDGYEFEHQLFAARGLVVLRVNYRGSSGRGASFAQTIVADWGHKEVEDLIAGVDYLVGRGIADKERLAIGGWSYGGILTDYTIATDRRFKAAISGAGSANQLSTYGTDQYILQYNGELGVPWRDTALWLKLSYPFFHADRIHTPTLFLGGDKDFNVPISGGEQMYQSLRTLGVPARLVVYPNEHHVFTRPSFVKDLA